MDPTHTSNLEFFWNEFLKARPTAAELIDVLARVPQIRAKAFAEFKKRNPTQDDMLLVLWRVKALRCPAWKLYEKTVPEESDLIEIAEQFPDLKTEAMAKMVNLPTPSSLVLHYVFENGPRGLARRAAQLILKKPSGKRFCKKIAASFPELQEEVDLAITREQHLRLLMNRLRGSSGKHPGHPKKNP